MARVNQALHLALDRGYAGRVVLIEMADGVAKDAQEFTRADILERMKGAVEVHVNARCTGIRPEGLLFADKYGQERLIAADTVVVAAGMRARIDEAMAFAGCARQWAQVGDCVKPANVLMAVRSGFDAANQI